MKEKQKKKEITKVGGFFFLVELAAVFFVFGIFLVSFLIIFVDTPLPHEAIIAFAFGAISIFSLMSHSSASRIRTFIHESKHALVIVLTGNKLKEFKVQKGEGHVSYEMYEDKLSYAPLIALAPYCLPLVTVPTLLACIWFDKQYRLPLCVALGVAFGIDLVTGIFEIHPAQTDLKKVIGGILISILFIGATIATWFIISLTWVYSGNQGLVFACEVGARICGKLALRFLGL